MNKRAGVKTRRGGDGEFLNEHERNKRLKGERERRMRKELRHLRPADIDAPVGSYELRRMMA